MSSVLPLTVPGLTGRTIVVTAAGTTHGTAQCLVLLASGADVVAIDDEPAIPPPLVDAGTGLPGVLAYRSLQPGWPSVADWIGERYAGLGGVVLNAGAELHETLHVHLGADAALVQLAGAGTAGLVTGFRWNRVVVPAEEPGRRHAERVAAIVAFLLSDLAHPVHGAELPVRAEP